MQKFQIEAILDGVTPLKDGGVSLRFHTNEISKADKVMLMDYYQSFGWLMFAANEFQESDVPKAGAKPDIGQSPSQRLRAVLFIKWKQSGGNGDFEAFYKQQLERFIDAVKAALDK
jgi:hypothetical protein